MPLSDKQIRLISAILEEAQINPEGVNPTRFKLRHEEDISELENLESLQLIRRNNLNKYEVPFSTVLAMQGKAIVAEGLISDCQHLFDVLKRVFRRDPEKDVTLGDLAKEADLPISRIYGALPYLVQVPIWGSHSTDLRSPNSAVRASEQILKYKTFSELAALLRGWAEHALRPIPPNSSRLQFAADTMSSILYPAQDDAMSGIPATITESLAKFKKDYAAQSKTAFVMMQFGKTTAHSRIFDSIRSALAAKGITALRADSKQYHDDLFPNVLTYVYGCDFGIAVFERIEEEAFSPNVSLEVGYMFGLGKSVCLLKDHTLKTLHTDLVGKLYRQFDPLDPAGRIPEELNAWLRDKEL
jgi:hypothetical protein